MSGRIGISLSLLALGFSFWAFGWHLWASIAFLLCYATALEIAMFNLVPYSCGCIKIGKAKESKIVKGNLLCVPIFLSFPYYTLNNLRAKIKVGGITVESCPFDNDGDSSDNDEFTLDFHMRKTLIAIGIRNGNNISFGTPVFHQLLEYNQNYSVTLEIWHGSRLVISSQYLVTPNLDIQDVNRRQNNGTT
jgi:hypothetical protein